jgi:hypothetical protein
MSKNTGSAMITYVAYVLLLFAFVLLGVFVAALALGSGVAGAAAVALATSLTASVVGFRVAASRRARAAKDAAYRDKLSIWTSMLQPDQIDRYRAIYRGALDEAQERLASPSDVDQAVARPRELQQAA